MQYPLPLRRIRVFPCFSGGGVPPRHHQSARHRRSPVLVGLVMVAVALAGCSGSAPGSSPSPSGTGITGSEPTTPAPTVTIATTTTTTIPGPVSAAGTWTVMVYAALDNNLDEPWQYTDLQEMKAVTRDVRDLRFVVLLDRSDEYSSEALGRLGNWTTAKLIDISRGRFTEIDDWGERDLKDPQTLVELFDAAASYAPADHYALVFKDHGGAMVWGEDDSVPMDDHLTNSEIAAALARGLESSGIGTLDLIAFDSCLMASLEAASAFHPYASYMIASEEISYSGAFNYSGFAHLVTDDDPTVATLGESLLSGFIDYLTDQVQVPIGTLSLLDLRRFPAFESALGDFVDAALENLDTSAAALGRRRDKVQKFGSEPDPNNNFYMVDLGQLLNRTGRSDTPIADEAARAADLLAEMVVGNVTGEASKGARGLSVFFPPAPHVGWFWGWFPTDSFYDHQGSPVWDSFLDAYFDAGRAIPPSKQPSFDASGPAAEFVFDDFGITVAAQFGRAAVDTMVSAVLWSGVEDPGGSVTFYEAVQGFEGEDPTSGIYAGIYDLSRMVLTDGVDSAYAFDQISFNDDLTFVTLSVPLWYRAPIDSSTGRYADPIEVTLIATTDMDTGEQTKGFFSSSGGGLGPFTPEPDGLLFPQVARRSPGGEIEWVSSTDAGLWADPTALFVDFEDLPSGTPLHLELTVADFGGNTATATVSTLIP